MEETSKIACKPAFSIDSLLAEADSCQEAKLDNEDNEGQDVDGLDELEDKVSTPLPLLVRPTPVLPTTPVKEMASARLSDSPLTLPTSTASENEEDAGPDSTAIAAALHGNLFYAAAASQPSTNFLYSQWLATRNTSALFGLQGTMNSRMKEVLLFV